MRHYGLCALHADAIGIAQGTHSADWAKFIVLGLIDWDLIERYGQESSHQIKQLCDVLSSHVVPAPAALPPQH